MSNPTHSKIPFMQNIIYRLISNYLRQFRFYLLNSGEFIATPRMFDKASNKDEILKILSKEEAFIEMKSDSNTGKITAVFSGTNGGLMHTLKIAGASVKKQKAANPTGTFADALEERNYITIEASKYESLLTHLAEYLEDRAWERRISDEQDLIIIIPTSPR